MDVVSDGELAGRDHALGLEADVEQHLVAVDLDHGALDQVTVIELDDRPGHGLLQGGTTHVVLSDLAGEVVAFGIEGPHGLIGQQGDRLGGHDGK